MQLRMHTKKVLKIAYLEASESPRKAFYLLWIEPGGKGFRVCKESGAGAGGTPLHRKAWECETIEQAEKLFEKMVRSKTRENRRSSRQYRRVQNAAVLRALSFVSDLMQRGEFDG